MRNVKKDIKMIDNNKQKAAELLAAHLTIDSHNSVKDFQALTNKFTAFESDLLYMSILETSRAYDIMNAIERS